MVGAADLRAAAAKVQAPAVWLAVASVCGMLGRLGRSPARWGSRRARALRRAGRLTAALGAYEQATRARDAGPEHHAGFARMLEQQQRWHEAAAIFRSAWVDSHRDVWLADEARCLRSAGDWAAVVDACHRALKHAPSSAVWHERLAEAQLGLRDLDGAAESYQVAIELDRQRSEPLIGLGNVHRERGDLLAAAAAFEQVGELGGAHLQASRVALADLYQDCGRWGDAVELLRAVVRSGSPVAAHLRAYSVAVLELHRWGGTFTGPLDRPVKYSPSNGASAELLRSARAAVRRALELEPSRASWYVTLAELEELGGRHRAAIEGYAEAVRRADMSVSRWSWLAKHPWQFRHQRAVHAAGLDAPVDPLFNCTTEPSGEGIGTVSSGPEGIFDVRFTATGVKLEGILVVDQHEHVEVRVDDVLLREVNVNHEAALRRFVLPLQRETIAMLPKVGRITVSTPDGARLRVPSGGDQLIVRVPHGDGSLTDALRDGRTVDKKGDMEPASSETDQRQQAYLELYGEVRDFFERHLGRDLFVIYGTLLGIHRDGDLIPGDDDFDAGYLSDVGDPPAVKEEAERIIVALVRGGYTVAFNRRGRLFRVMRPGTPGGRIHLDLRPLWFSGGQVWLHNYATFPAALDDFLPVTEGSLRGIRLSMPRRPETFLEGHYGPGWRVPDPGFMYYRGDIDPSIHAYLDQALITPAEYQELQRAVRAATTDAPGAGRLVAIGAQDLYPLEEVIW